MIIKVKEPGVICYAVRSLPDSCSQSVSALVRAVLWGGGVSEP